eukprot:10203251-Lingulodinium_polyedra.AAC.1
MKRRKVSDSFSLRHLDAATLRIVLDTPTAQRVFSNVSNSVWNGNTENQLECQTRLTKHSPRQSNEEDDPEAIAAEPELMDPLVDARKSHHMPTFALGCGRTTLADKDACLLHGCVLE